MMMIVCSMLKMEFAMGRIKKKINAKTVLTLLAFSQNLVQGMWMDDDPFLQLPHVDYDRLKQFRKKNKQITFENFCRLSTEERRALGLYETESSKNVELFEDCEKAITSFPVIDVQVSHFVEGETDIAVGDFLTIRLTITHTNIKDTNT